MKRRKIAWLALLLAVAVAGLLRYSWSVQGARSRRVMVGRDVSDASSVNPAQAKSGYTPYFVRANHSANITLPGTNTTARTQ
jgi:ABC-type oligopeptide transport system substrate-binding subunit